MKSWIKGKDYPEHLTEEALQVLNSGYLLPKETPRDMYRRVSKAASSILNKPELESIFFSLIDSGKLGLASPVASNLGTTRGLPVSCLAGDTWINTKTGGVRIGDIKIGEKVLTHEGRWKRVTAKQSRMSTDDLYKIKVGFRATPIEVTGNHPILTNLGWVRVDELDVNKHLVAINDDVEFEEAEYTIDLLNYISYPTKEIDGRLYKAIENNGPERKKKKDGIVSYYSSPNRFIKVDKDLAWCIGLWLAEGSRTINTKKQPNGIRITIGHDEEHLAIKWLDIMNKKFNLNGSYYKSESTRPNFAKGKTTRWISANFNGKAIGTLFCQEFGINCKTKTLPQWIIDLPNDILRSLLEGVIVGDGHIRRNDTWQITLANPALLLGFYNIALKLKLPVSLQMQTKASSIGTTAYVYTLYLRKNQVIGSKKESLRSSVKFGKLRFSDIRLLEKLNYNKEVFDITVSKDHSFSACGVVFHNCNSLHLEDSVSGIFDKVSELACLSKHGAGVGVYLGDVRGRGAPITGNGASEGIIPWAKCFDTTTAAVSQGCYDDTTEVLTERGWLLFKDLNKHPNVKVVQIDNKGVASFTNYFDYTEYEVKEDLFNITNTTKSMDLLVTGTHRMAIERRKRISNRRTKDGKFLNNTKQLTGYLDIVLAEDLKLHRDNRVWTNPRTFPNKLESLSYLDRFKIAYQADGASSPSGKSNGNVSNTIIYNFHFKKERKIKRLKDILESLDWKYTELYGKQDDITISVRVPKDIRLEKQLKKMFELSKFSKSYSEEFIKEVGNWDGSFSNNERSMLYSCIEEENVDFVQCVSFIAGLRGFKRFSINREGNRQDLYSVNITNTSSIGGEELHITKSYYEGKVYCISVPEGLLAVRRNGQYVICGNSSRRGATALYLPIDHPDIEEFLRIRRNTLEENRRCLNTHHAVCIPDSFMNKVVAGDEKARDLLTEVYRTRLETGEPYIFFSDNVNKANPPAYVNNNLKVSLSNLCCVAPETMILTDKGDFYIKDKVNQKVKVWDGEQFSEVLIQETGIAKLYDVTLSDGTLLTVTNNHKFPIKSRGLVPLKDMKPGDRLVTYKTPDDPEPKDRRVLKIKETKREEMTYCFNNPNNGLGTFNGIVTGNSEVVLYTDPDHTFVCCLSSLNLTRWNDITDDDIYYSTIFLDAVLTEYIEKAKKIKGFENAVRSAEKGRAIGLGALGFHTLLQSEGTAFDSFRAKLLNKAIFKRIREQAERATRDLAKEYGEPEWCKGLGVRNTHLLAVAPTASNSILCGSVSQGIEPIAANMFANKTNKGTFVRKNKYLQEVLKNYNKDNEEIWSSITVNAGSVQHLDFLSEDHKSVFKTAFEINQLDLIELAIDRQEYIDQAQSLNLFFPANTNAAFFHKVHMRAWEGGLKTLYYCRSNTIIKGDVTSRSQDDCKACEG